MGGGCPSPSLPSVRHCKTIYHNMGQEEPRQAQHGTLSPGKDVNHNSFLTVQHLSTEKRRWFFSFPPLHSQCSVRKKAFLRFFEEDPQTLKELKNSETSIFRWVGDINMQKLKSYTFSYYCDFPARKHVRMTVLYLCPFITWIINGVIIYFIIQLLYNLSLRKNSRCLTQSYLIKQNLQISISTSDMSWCYIYIYQFKINFLLIWYDSDPQTATGAVESFFLCVC